MNDTFLDWNLEMESFDEAGQCSHDFYIPKGYFLVTNIQTVDWSNDSSYELCNYFQECFPNDSEGAVWQQIAIPPPTFSFILKVRTDSAPKIANYKLRLVSMQAFRKSLLLPMDESTSLYIYQLAEMLEGYTYIFSATESPLSMFIIPYPNVTKNKELSNIFLYNGNNSNASLLGTLLKFSGGEEFHSPVVALYVAKRVLLSPVAIIVQYSPKKSPIRPCVVYPTASTVILSSSPSTCTILNDRTDDGHRYSSLTLTVTSLVGESVTAFDGYPNEKWSDNPILTFGNSSLALDPINRPRYLSGRARTLYLTGESAEFVVSNTGEEETIVSSDGGAGILFNSYIGPGQLEEQRVIQLAGGNETAEGGQLYRYEFSWLRNGTALVEIDKTLTRKQRK